MGEGGVIETWTVGKPAVESSAGLVASQHFAVSEVGARVLAAGGNAVDAAVATGLAIGAVEPWMSGLGGGGFMVVQRAGEPEAQAIDFTMIAPAGLKPADYPVVGAPDSDLFGWPLVEDNRNLEGATSFAVPGLVAGLGLALERFGSRPWAEMLAPAIELADAGLVVDWYATFTIAASARALARHPESARIYLPEGLPPAGEWGRPPPRLELRGLAATLRRLAEAGPRDFYEGEIAGAIAEDSAGLGGSLSAADLARYEAKVVPVAGASYRGARIGAAPGLSAGPTLLAALDSLAGRELDEGEPGAASTLAYAECLMAATRDRLASMGHADAPSCTTHISVADAQGNVVALTQTLLSLFGSKVVLPTSVPSMTQDSQTLDYVRFSGYENTSMHMAVSRGSGAIGTADRGPEHAAEGGLALADRASVGGGMRHHGDHAAHRDIKADGVALAGALPGGRGRWPVARQEPAAGDAAAERRHQDAGG